jgi:hydroxymethylglutaryl-CoA lyase
MSHEFENMHPSQVEIIEVGPRDGLQREEIWVPTEEKVALIEALGAAGIRRIQVASFVHPELVPQMADAEKVCVSLSGRDGVIYSGLALNLQGVQRAQSAGLSHIDISISANEEHSRRNLNRSLDEALAEFAMMHEKARSSGMTIRGAIQCAFGYLRPGDVQPDVVIDMASRFLDLGVDELALADSSGLANPQQMTDMLQSIIPLAGKTPVMLHLHDTRGMGLANVLAALRSGVRHFDTSFGGLGGCPFIKGAAGNIPTEDTINMLHDMGIETGVDVRQVAYVSRQMEQRLGKASLPGKLYALLEPFEEEP